jgi:hypothetical protein
MSHDTQPANDEGRVTTDEKTFSCPYCSRRFTSGDLRTLHLGWEHPNEITETEREAFDEVYSTESEELRLFRLKLVLAIVLLYFGLLLTYAFFT